MLLLASIRLNPVFEKPSFLRGNLTFYPMEVQTMNKVSKVFILQRFEHLDETVVGVFATKEAAMDWARKWDLDMFNHTICSYPLKY